MASRLTKSSSSTLLKTTREGFLNQKLIEPRSYDYNRIAHVG